MTGSMTNIALIEGHPDADPLRYCHALADAYAEGGISGRHDVRRIAIAGLDFPLLRTRVQWAEEPAPSSIAQAQQAIAWAQHLVFIYPLWLGDMPALLKGFLEQVARPGFAVQEGARPRGLLTGRSARLVVTMGMPTLAYRVYFGAHSVKSFERNILGFSGVRPIRRTLIGNVEGSHRSRDRWLQTMFELGEAAI